MSDEDLGFWGMVADKDFDEEEGESSWTDWANEYFLGGAEEQAEDVGDASFTGEGSMGRMGRRLSNIVDTMNKYRWMVDPNEALIQSLRYAAKEWPLVSNASPSAVVGIIAVPLVMVLTATMMLIRRRKKQTKDADGTTPLTPVPAGVTSRALSNMDVVATPPDGTAVRSSNRQRGNSRGLAKNSVNRSLFYQSAIDFTQEEKEEIAELENELSSTVQGKGADDGGSEATPRAITRAVSLGSDTMQDDTIHEDQPFPSPASSEAPPVAALSIEPQYDEDEDTMASSKPKRPLKLTGTQNSTFSFVTSTPPPDRPAVFSSTKYHSIHRKLVLDVHKLTLTRCMPLTHPTVIKGEIHELDVRKQTFEETGKTVPITSVLNVSALPPVAGGVLDITLSEKTSSSSSAKADKDGQVKDDSRVTKENWHDFDCKIHNKLAPKKEEDGMDYNVESIREGDVIAEMSVGIHHPVSKEDEKKKKKNQKKKESKESEAKTLNEEHTFQSTLESAEFQHVTLAMRIVGSEIRNMFCGLELVHMGSEGHGGDEFVLKGMRFDADYKREGGEGGGDGGGGGDKKDGEGEDAEKKLSASDARAATGAEKKDGGEEKKEKGDEGAKKKRKEIPVAGVALDDVMRCLGSIKPIRKELDRYYAYHYPEDGIVGGGNSSPTKKDEQKQSADNESKDEEAPDTLIAVAADARTEADIEKLTSRAGMYRRRRKLLGYVDFFRLFVPSLADYEEDATKVPVMPYTSPSAARGPHVKNGISVHKARIRDMVKVRKIVGHAALYVRSYVKGMKVVNEGWTVPAPPPPTQRELSHPPSMVDTSSGTTPPPASTSSSTTKSTTSGGENYNQHPSRKSKHPKAKLTRRLAYDDDVANILHDMPNKNEYYEATVSRDVLSSVHTKRHVVNPGTSKTSPYQAYSLVALHTFQLPPVKGSDDDKVHPLQSGKDPVMALPSLRKIIEEYSDMEFFVQAFFPEGPRLGFVFLFVRTLPAGVDWAFDRIMDRYAHGPSELRDRKLEVFCQLGPGPGLSTLAWAGLKAMSALLSLTRRQSGEARIPFRSGGGKNDRTPFPGMTLSRYTKTNHFGGSLQTDPSLPRNYVSMTAHIDGENIRNVAVKMLYQRLEDGAMYGSIVDFTLVLEGETEDELPERALGTVRMVHVDGLGVALPVAYSARRTEGQMLQEEMKMSATTGPEHSRTTLESKPPAQSALESGVVQRESFPNFLDSVQEVDEMNLEEEQGDATAAGGGKDKEEKKEEGDDEDEEDDLLDAGDPYKDGVDALCEILDGVTVPMRRENLDHSSLTTSTTGTGGQHENRDGGDTILRRSVAAANTEIATPLSLERDTSAKKVESPPAPLRKEDTANVPVLNTLNRYDLRRYYIACDCNLKRAAVRIVESAAWRGVTFPVDTRVCRVELQTGQFFQQGRDREGHPIFYFRNMCLGPWRKDVDAIVFAVLHRLERAMNRLVQDNPEVRCTVIVLMGRPIEELEIQPPADDDSTAAEGGGGQASSSSTVATSATASSTTSTKKKRKKQAKVMEKQRNPFFIGANPRLDPEEDYYVHTNYALVQRLNEVLSRHYPERLAKALIVPSNGWNKTLGTVGLRAYVPAQRTRARVKMLNGVDDLKSYVDEEELVTFVGGKALVVKDAFFV